jgi:uncharacterized membrane protein YfcA
MVRSILLGLFGVFGGLVIAVWWRAAARDKREGRGDFRFPDALRLGLGAATNFFDTLGIGSFATTTTAFTMLRLVPPERVPGTLIVGHTLPVVAQAFLFLAIVEVESATLLTLIIAMLAGGAIGVRVVSRLPRQHVQLAMGAGLLVAGAFMALGQVGLFPAGGTALGLHGGALAFAATMFFLLGGLLMVGIGHYGPCLVLLSILGMNPRAAFPIMMGAGGLVGPIGCFEFLRTGRVDHRVALGLTLGGIPAVLAAALLIKSLPLDVLRWIVVAVVAWTGVTLLRTATRPHVPPPTLNPTR